MRLGVLLLTKISTYPAVEDTAEVGAAFEYPPQLAWACVCSQDTRLRCRANFANLEPTRRSQDPRDRDFLCRFPTIHRDFVVH